MEYNGNTTIELKDKDCAVVVKDAGNNEVTVEVYMPKGEDEDELDSQQLIATCAAVYIKKLINNGKVLEEFERLTQDMFEK